MEITKKRKKTKSLLKSKYIPPELLPLIFATLPVKTLVRFRCVCKSWCSVIDHPDFVSMHLKLCKTNIDSKKLLAIEGFGDYGYEGCLLTVRHSNTLRKSAQIFKSSEITRLLGKCNGLLLMWYSNELRLWNPSIRKSLAIPPCPLCQPWFCPVVFLFGYANDSKDYKIIAISFEEDEIRMTGPVRNICVAVYTLNDQQWRLRDNHDLNISCWYFGHMFPHNYHQTNVLKALNFQGAAYWIAKDPNSPDSYESTHLVSLDFDLEKFTYLELPFASEKRWALNFVFRLGESLAVFSAFYETARIWVMEQEVWTPWFSGPLSSDNCPQETPVFYSESDAGRCLLSGKYSYNIDSCQVRSLGRQMRSHLNLETYLESLALCKGYGAEDLTSLP
ncbi:putative F-box protein At5g62060 [Silene latifolia]|uniref:putative F-box protein At5g62060 n=1 Tax=Silene latifolia TaxID=37657 RepID=UPI003D775C95